MPVQTDILNGELPSFKTFVLTFVFNRLISLSGIKRHVTHSSRWYSQPIPAVFNGTSLRLGSMSSPVKKLHRDKCCNVQRDMQL